MLEPPSSPKKLELNDYTLFEWLEAIFRLKLLDGIKFGAFIFGIISVSIGIGIYWGNSSAKEEAKSQIAQIERRAEKSEEMASESSRRLMDETRKFTEELSRCMAERLQPRNGSAAPSRWQDYRGFDFLAGTWQGDLNGFSGIKITIEPQDGDQVVAKLELKNTSCRMSLNLFQATDNMLTESEFFFRPTTASSGCPEIRNVMLRPNQSRSIIRITSSNDRVTEGFLFKRI